MPHWTCTDPVIARALMLAAPATGQFYHKWKHHTRSVCYGSLHIISTDAVTTHPPRGVELRAPLQSIPSPYVVHYTTL